VLNGRIGASFALQFTVGLTLSLPFRRCGLANLYRLQIDLLEIQPGGANWERCILAVICVDARYPFFRCATSRDAPDLATLLLDVMLDCGVAPAVV
jgi:hypothetical protein